MKVKFLTSLCGGKIDYHAGDEANINDNEALRLIDAGFVEAINQKAYKDLVTKVEKAKDKELEKQKEVEALMYKDELLAEKATLTKRLAEINGILKEK